MAAFGLRLAAVGLRLADFGLWLAAHSWFVTIGGCCVKIGSCWVMIGSCWVMIGSYNVDRGIAPVCWGEAPKSQYNQPDCFPVKSNLPKYHWYNILESSRMILENKASPSRFFEYALPDFSSSLYTINACFQNSSPSSIFLQLSWISPLYNDGVSASLCAGMTLKSTRVKGC